MCVYACKHVIVLKSDTVSKTNSKEGGWSHTSTIRLLPQNEVKGFPFFKSVLLV